jgi:hypothetical protein
VPSIRQTPQSATWNWRHVGLIDASDTSLKLVANQRMVSNLTWSRQIAYSDRCEPSLSIQSTFRAPSRAVSKDEEAGKGRVFRFLTIGRCRSHSVFHCYVLSMNEANPGWMGRDSSDDILLESPRRDLTQFAVRGGRDVVHTGREAVFCAL